MGESGLREVRGANEQWERRYDKLEEGKVRNRKGSSREGELRVKIDWGKSGLRVKAEWWRSLKEDEGQGSHGNTH